MKASPDETPVYPVVVGEWMIENPPFGYESEIRVTNLTSGIRLRWGDQLIDGKGPVSILHPALGERWLGMPVDYDFACMVLMRFTGRSIPPRPERPM